MEGISLLAMSGEKARSMEDKKEELELEDPREGSGKARDFLGEKFSGLRRKIIAEGMPAMILG